MRDTKRWFLIPASLALVLAACGGGSGGPSGGASSGPTQGASTQGPTDANPTDAPESQGAPTGGPDATPGDSNTGGGGGGGDACTLVTADEAGGILGVSGVTVDLTPGDFSYCFYRESSGDAVAATAYTKRGGSSSFAIWKAGAGVQQIDGIGDDAVFDPASATLFVLKGDAIYSITAGISSDSEADRLGWAKQFGQTAAGRM